MRIVCLGGGPAGLYFATLIKRADPAHQVRVIERSAADDTYGWGVVFSDQTLDGLQSADPETYRRIRAALVHWDDIDVHYRGSCIRSHGHGFAGIGRARLLHILQERALELGVELNFNTPAGAPSDYPDADLIVAADGIHSPVRNALPEVFQPDIQLGDCRYLWLGSSQALDAFTFDFRETEWGWFSLHAYRYDNQASTYIVETPDTVWQAAGLDKADTAASIAFCEKLFQERLGGQHLALKPCHARGGAWLRFNRLVCRRWYHGNVVLLGDAAHTAHYSIGSGTKLAMEDAIALAQALAAEAHVPSALARYQAEREPAVLRLQSAARNRQEWFEHVARYTGMAPLQFSYTLLTGSQRLGHDNLKARDPDYIAQVEADLAHRCGLDRPVPPMFTPFTLGGLSLTNRVVVSPMATYSATDGMANDFHLTHLGSRAQGGAGLVMTEMTAASPDGRITPRCAGLWNDEQQAAWTRIVDFVHRQSAAKIGLQLGHAGAKGATCVPWEGIDQPLAENAWTLLAPSALPWRPYSAVPAAMNQADMDRIEADFVAAAQRALAAGFDVLELHCAHGYLLSAFLTPLWNRREDEYGGSLENRLRFPLRVFAAIRAVWPKPLLVRISAHDWMPPGSMGCTGNTCNDAVAIAAAFKAAGADMIDVSSGQTHPDAQPVYGRMYQTPFSDRIRNEVGIPTMTVGNITEADQVNTIIAAGRADLCALGRPHLADPYWTLHAGAAQGVELPWPAAYRPGRDQLMKQVATTAETAS